MIKCRTHLTVGGYTSVRTEAPRVTDGYRRVSHVVADEGPQVFEVLRCGLFVPVGGVVLDGLQQGLTRRENPEVAVRVAAVRTSTPTVVEDVPDDRGTLVAVDEATFCGFDSEVAGVAVTDAESFRDVLDGHRFGLALDELYHLL